MISWTHDRHKHLGCPLVTWTPEIHFKTESPIIIQLLLLHFQSAYAGIVFSVWLPDNHFPPNMHSDDYYICLNYSAFTILMIVIRSSTAFAVRYPRAWHRNQQKSSCVSLAHLWHTSTFVNEKAHIWNKYDFLTLVVAPFNDPRWTQCSFFVFIPKIKWCLSGNVCQYLSLKEVIRIQCLATFLQHSCPCLIQHYNIFHFKHYINRFIVDVLSISKAKQNYVDKTVNVSLC